VAGTEKSRRNAPFGLFLALKKIFLFNPALAIGVARFQTDTGTLLHVIAVMLIIGQIWLGRMGLSVTEKHCNSVVCGCL